MRINSVGHDGSDLVEVVDLGDQGHVLFNVSWSPDGSEILYVNDGQVYLVGANGDDVKVLTQKASSQYHAAWSPDGSRIAVHDGAVVAPEGHYILPNQRPDVALFTMARDGSDVRILVRDKRIRLEAENSGSPATTVLDEIGSCSGGKVVPSPAGNPGLVSDCETLLSMRGTLDGDLILDWGRERPIGNWEGIRVEGSPPRVTELVFIGDLGRPHRYNSSRAREPIRAALSGTHRQQTGRQYPAGTGPTSEPRIFEPCPQPANRRGPSGTEQSGFPKKVGA